MINELRQMAIFVKTIDHGSFRAAARAMKLSPSVVSHQISELEKQLGVALIYRSTRSLSLTRDGEQLLAHARTMVDSAEEGLRAISERTPEPSGELRITLPAVLAHSHLVQQFAEFGIANANVKLSLDFSDTRKDLINDGFDLAISMGWLKDSALIAKKLSTIKRRLVVAKSYVKTRPTPANPKDIEDWDWITLSPVQGKKTTFKNDASETISIKTNSHISVNDAHALYQFAHSGAGLAIVPEFLAEADMHIGKVEYVLPDWHVEDLGLYAVWPQNAPKNGLTKILIEHLTN